ncbi:PLP-dependent aminotransferase family protein [Rhodococcus sp. HNM0563]|uniref:MocR-like transcription factor YczR n=1 Tax=unclassified Rhodococcus (in: high G+C Gram-positive bacteria) TaxID=192944 RepID=UPI00146D9C97|nr:PLP-dependent aminotransferase family protein [Rhodococcus sp. F64268]MCK0090321.1 PLP-dependent aminotransferase family protein [Rhodococcus sp. F64268]NLU61529.1 PLP-dependent aminotransferase family protein [Rhodococcus sp. HNM0563]
MITRAIGASSLVRDLGNWQDTGDVRSAYRALADGIRLLVHDGRVPQGVALPSERELASALSLSRTTVTSAYSALRDEGYLRSRQGARSTVAMPAGGARARNAVKTGPPGVDAIDMSNASLPAPAAEIEAAYELALRSMSVYLSSHGMEPIGVTELREVIARRYRERGLPTSPEQIMVTSGAQHAMRLLLGVLTDPGDRVIVDHPTYPNALEAIRRHGARPIPVPVRPEAGPSGGWDLGALASASRQTAARTAFLVPDFHNPTGLCLDEDGRAELARIMYDARMTLVVDETMVDLWLDAPAPPPVASFPAGSSVVTIGSTGKSLWGGLRVGWIRADRELIGRLTGARSGVDLGTPVMEQFAAAHLLSDVEELLEQRRTQLREQRQALCEALDDRLPDWQYTEGQGGMSLWVRMPEPVSTSLAAIAPSHGVLLAAGPRFGVQGAFERFLRLPYTQQPDSLRHAVAMVADAYAQVAQGGDIEVSRLVV